MKNPRGSSQHQPSLHVCTLERDKIREKRRKGRKEKKKNGKNEKKKQKKKEKRGKKMERDEYVPSSVSSFTSVISISVNGRTIEYWVPIFARFLARAFIPCRKCFFFSSLFSFFFYGEKRNEGRSIIKIVRRVSRDPIKKVRRQHSPFCNWPWSAFIFACNRKCCASLSRISTGTVKIPAILVKYVQAVRSPRNLVSRPVRRPNSRSPCHGGCIAGTGRTKKYYCTSNITFNWKIRSKLKMYTISRVYLHFIFIFCNSFVDKFQFQ